MKTRIKKIQDATYGTDSKNEKYWFLTCLIRNEYHQDPEWEFLKGKDGKTMTEEEYLRDILFETEWTVEMLEELVVDIEEVLSHEDDKEVSEIVESTGPWTATTKVELVRSWLTGLLNLAKQKIEERR